MMCVSRASCPRFENETRGMKGAKNSSRPPAATRTCSLAKPQSPQRRPKRGDSRTLAILASLREAHLLPFRPSCLLPSASLRLRARSTHFTTSRILHSPQVTLLLCRWRDIGRKSRRCTRHGTIDHLSGGPLLVSYRCSDAEYEWFVRRHTHSETTVQEIP